MCSGRSHLFPVCICMDSGSVYVDTGAAARSNPQPTSDLCLTIMELCHSSIPLCLSFPGIGSRSYATCLRPAECFRLVQQAGLCNLLVPFVFPSCKNVRVLVEVDFAPIADIAMFNIVSASCGSSDPSPAFPALLVFLLSTPFMLNSKSDWRRALRQQRLPLWSKSCDFLRRTSGHSRHHQSS